MIPGTVGPIWLRFNTTKEDLDLMLKWRNNPAVYQGFYQQDREILPHEHVAWWKSRNKDWQSSVIMYNNTPVGIVTIGQLDYWEPEIGIYIGETSLWGKGIGRQALQIALDWLEQKGYKYTRTTILDSNERSIRLFRSLGYERIANARPEESLYRKDLNE